MSPILKVQVAQQDAVKVQAASKSITRFFTALVPAAMLVSTSMFSIAQDSRNPLPNPPIASRQATSGFQPEIGVAKTPGRSLIAPAQPLTAEEAAEAVTAATTTTLNFPYGLAVDTAGNIYVANIFGNNVTVYSHSLRFIGSFSAGMTYPAAVAVAFGGNIFVANNGGNNITIYSPQYQLIGTITDSTLQNPASMYIDGDNDIWVLDALGTVHLYLDNGTPISSQALGSGTAIGPWGSNVAVWGVSNASGTVELVQNAGEAVHSGVGFPLVYPDSPLAGGESQDAQGNQYVTVPGGDAIEIFTANGLGYGQILTTKAPAYGIAIDPINKRMYFSETTVGKVEAYSLNGYAKIGTIE